METGNLVLKAKLDSAPLFRVYINPCQDEMDDDSEEAKWMAYQGYSFLIAPADLDWKVELITSSGKNGLKKSKEQDDWNENYIPLSQDQMDEITIKRSGLFKKADPSIARNQLFCKMPSPKNKQEEIIENILKFFQKNKDDCKNPSFAFVWINEVFGKETKAYVAVDIFKPDSEISLTETYHIEWDEKFEFSKLSFLAEQIDSTDPFLPRTPMKLLGACVYNGKLYFDQQNLEFLPSYINRPAHTVLEHSLVMYDEMNEYLGKIFEEE